MEVELLEVGAVAEGSVGRRSKSGNGICFTGKMIYNFCGFSTFGELLTVRYNYIYIKYVTCERISNMYMYMYQIVYVYIYIHIILELNMEISTHPYYRNIFEHLILYLLKDDDIYFQGSIVL